MPDLSIEKPAWTKINNTSGGKKPRQAKNILGEQGEILTHSSPSERRRFNQHFLSDSQTEVVLSNLVWPWRET